MNHYANKKSAAESMLDVALLMANASQLKAVLQQGQNFPFYTPIVTLISISVCLQVTVGVLLIFIGEKINSLEVSVLAGELHISQPSFALLWSPPHPTMSRSKIEAYHMPPFALQYFPSPMSSPLTPDKQPITSWTRAVTMAIRPDTRSEFTRF